MGYICDAQFVRRSGEEAASTNAAQVDSAKGAKRSAPIPAMSPTLSPTLSAMHAGFWYSSSFRNSLAKRPAEMYSLAFSQAPPERPDGSCAVAGELDRSG